MNVGRFSHSKLMICALLAISAHAYGGTFMGPVNISILTPVLTSVADSNADFDRNFFVDFFDYTFISRNWQLSPDPFDPNSGDIVKDGIVDIYDLMQFCIDWLTCYVTEATNPVPNNFALDVNTNVILRWSSGNNTFSHNVYFGTDYNDVNFAAEGYSTYRDNQDANYWDSNSYDPNGLDTNTTYYWRIDEVAACTAKGNVWSFTTSVILPGQSSNPSPSNGATDINIITVVLSWTAGNLAISHDVYFGTNNPPPFIGNQTGTTYTTGAMDTNTTYYWRIDEKNTSGITTGEVWSFITSAILPGQASNPTPSNGATNINITTDISWTAGSLTTSHDVYFGTTNPPSFIGNQTGTTYDTGTMVINTTYYWRIDEKNTSGTTTGNVWYFKTVPAYKRTAPDGAADDYFGYSVSINGNRCIVGTEYHNSAYIFEWNGTNWVQQAKLTASDGAVFNYFGESVCLSDNRCIVGASGSAYIFEWNGTNWVQQAKLTAPDGYFGRAVSISDNRCIVGAYGGSSAYIFEWNGTNWVQQARLTASDGDPSDYFGYSVSISGNRCIVGAFTDDDKEYGSGSAYIFEWNGTNWVETKLTASDGALDDNFGRSVCISDNRCIVGATGNNSAYIFEWNGTNWTQQAKLTAADGIGSFGLSVSISGDLCIVGVPFDDDKGYYSGSAYIFKWNGTNWFRKVKLTAYDGAAFDLFGYAVSISGDLCIVGAYGDDDMGSSSGSAYIYDLGP